MESQSTITDSAVEPLALEALAELGRLGDEIAELAVHLNAAAARLLDLIREFDARGGWNHGFRSCAAWLTWRVGFSPTTAREHVRVARALTSLLPSTPPRHPRGGLPGRARGGRRAAVPRSGWPAAATGATDALGC
jgi:Domain of unknown function (DUF222)